MPDPLMSTSPWDQVRSFAARLPYAIEDFPWDELVVKIDYPERRRRNGLAVGPMFGWLGRPDAAAVSVKLTISYDEAVAVSGAIPTTMSGLGQWGWLAVPLLGTDLGLIYDWVQESYRNVAPKKLVEALESCNQFPIADP